MKMKVLVKGHFSVGNFGDDALLVATRSLFRKAFDSADVSFDVPHLAYLDEENKKLKIATESDRIFASTHVYNGGTQFFSFGLTQQVKCTTGLLGRALGKLRQPEVILQRVLRYIGMFLIRHRIILKNIVALGVGFGPFVKGSIEEDRARQLLKNIDFLWIRDHLSYKFCVENKAKNIVEGPDLCFLPEFREKLNLSNSKKTLKKNKIAFVVRDWPHSKEGSGYVDNARILVEDLRKEGFSVSFVVFDKGDNKWLKRLEEMEERILLWDPKSMSIKEFLECLHQFDCFITARYHGAIFAMLLQRPFIAVDVEPKLQQVAEKYSRCAALWSHPFNVDIAKNQIKQLMTDSEKIKEVLAAILTEETELARQCERQFLCFMEKRT